MEDKITHYRFQKGIYKIKHYKDVCNIPEYNSDYIRTEKKGIWNRKNIEQQGADPDSRAFLRWTGRNHRWCEIRDERGEGRTYR